MEFKTNRHRYRLFLLLFLVLGAAGSLLSRLHDVQIEQQDIARERIPGNSTVSIRTPGVRGIITDRTGEVILAKNLREYEVTLNLEEISAAYRQEKKEKLTFDTLGRDRDGMPEKRSEIDIVTVFEQYVRPKLKELGIADRYNKKELRIHFKSHEGLIPFRYPVSLTYDQFARLAENTLDIPGVYVGLKPKRYYPYGTLACHVIGYLKNYEKGSIPLAEKKYDYDHYFGDDRGIMGVESTMNERLTGLPGVKTVIKNDKRRVIGIQDLVPPGQGANVTLTIDARLQYTVENILRQAGRAAAVVMDVHTGEVLAMASIPNYNPNEFIGGISQTEFDVYNTNKAHPFINRCISAYMPGSTYKLPMALIACMDGRASHTCNCYGSISYGRQNKPIHCHRKSGHGRLKLANAIKQSCNPYFMSVANNMGSQKVADGLEQLGFGKRSGIQLPAEHSGMVPCSRIWKTDYRPGEFMTPALLAMTSIGQSDAQASPLQITAITACIANGGKYYQPRIIKKIDHPTEGETIKQPKLLKDLIKDGLKPSDLQTIRLGMYKAANEEGGTAGRAGLIDYKVAAKTGTVQAGTKSRPRNNAWTTAYAPYNDARYAVTVYVEGGKSGGKVAGALVHQIFRALFTSESGIRLPLAKIGYYGGHFDVIDEIKIPENQLLATALEVVGETGDETSDAILISPDMPIKVTPTRIPLPSITPDADSE